MPVFYFFNDIALLAALIIV